MSDPLRTWLGDRRPVLLLTLGSGLGGLADALEDADEQPFAALGLPQPTVPGHAGRFLAGRLAGVEVLVQQGRLHRYEGADTADIVAPVRAAAAVGVRLFVVTNAAGGLRADLGVGDLVVLTDQLNLTGASPLTGQSPPAFLDMSEAYDAGLRRVLRAAATARGERLVDGVYAGVAGPAFETPAEAAALRVLGADVVGMSTVLEVLAARAAGLRVLGCSLVSNTHVGRAPTDHAAVLAAGAAAAPAWGACCTPRCRRWSGCPDCRRSRIPGGPVFLAVPYRPRIRLAALLPSDWPCSRPDPSPQPGIVLSQPRAAPAERPAITVPVFAVRGRPGR